MVASTARGLPADSSTQRDAVSSKAVLRERRISAMRAGVMEVFLQGTGDVQYKRRSKERHSVGEDS